MSHARFLASLLAAGIAGASALSAAAATAPAGGAIAQPALEALAAPHTARLRDAGIHRIVARPGHGWRDLQVLTAWGAIYFAWPRDVAAASFDVEVGGGGPVTVRAPGAAPADQARYAAAFDAVFAEAVRRAHEVRASAERPRP